MKKFILLFLLISKIAFGATILELDMTSLDPFTIVNTGADGSITLDTIAGANYLKSDKGAGASNAWHDLGFYQTDSVQIHTGYEIFIDYYQQDLPASHNVIFGLNSTASIAYATVGGYYHQADPAYFQGWDGSAGGGVDIDGLTLYHARLVIGGTTPNGTMMAYYKKDGDSSWTLLRDMGTGPYDYDGANVRFSINHQPKDATYRIGRIVYTDDGTETVTTTNQSGSSMTDSRRRRKKIRR